MHLRDGLYVVEKDQIFAAFVVRDGEVTTCAPVLRKKLEYWKTVAKYYPTDVTIPPPQVDGEFSS